MKYRYLYIVLLLLVFSCSKENEIDIPVPKGRTVLVYLAGDHNLSHEVATIHAALTQGWDNNIVGSLVVFADRNNSSPVLIKIEEHKNKKIADTLRIYTNENSASPELLREVISDTKRLVPGESYGMVLYSHASGWLPPKSYENPVNWRPVSKENSQIATYSIFEDQGREMELTDFADAIPDGMFDFIASEMCFMSSVEIAYALRNKTDYLLASAPEVLVPGFTPIYSTSLELLFKPQADLKGFAQAYFNHVEGLQGANRSAAISLVRTSEMDALAKLTREIAPSLDQMQIDQLQYYDGTFNRDSKGIPHVFFDFGDYIHQIATSKQKEQMDDLLSRIVVFKLNTPTFLNLTIKRHSGLTVYIQQENKGLFYLNEAYKETDWYKATH